MTRVTKTFKLLVIIGLSLAGTLVASTEGTPNTTLEQDWLFQADGKPTVARVREEIKWAREMVARLPAQVTGVAGALRNLAEIEAAIGLPNVAPDDVTRLYLRTRQVKRQIMFADPHVDFNQILFIDIPYPHNPDASKWDHNSVEWGHEARHRNGFMSPVGGRLLVLNGLTPDAPVKDLLAGREGAHWRPTLSYDGKKVVFSHKPKG